MLQAVIIYLALVGFETGRAEQIMLQSFIYTKYTNLGDVQKSFQFLGNHDGDGSQKAPNFQKV